MTLEDRLNAAEPPAVLDGIEVEMFSLTGPVRFVGPRDHRPPLELRWHRPDGRTLLYRHWVDGDGERYYLPDEWRRRAGIRLGQRDV